MILYNTSGVILGAIFLTIFSIFGFILVGSRLSKEISSKKREDKVRKSKISLHFSIVVSLFLFVLGVFAITSSISIFVHHERMITQIKTAYGISSDSKFDGSTTLFTEGSGTFYKDLEMDNGEVIGEAVFINEAVGDENYIVLYDYSQGEKKLVPLKNADYYPGREELTSAFLKGSVSLGVFYGIFFGIPKSKKIKRSFIHRKTAIV